MALMKEKILKSTSIIMGITILCKILGFIEKQFLAYFFGTGIEIDACLVALSIPLMLFVIVGEIAGPAFLPIFVEAMKNKGEDKAWKLTSSVINLLAILLGIVIIVGIIIAPWLIRLFAPGFEHERFTLAVKLSRVMLPAAFFLGISSITYLILNAYKRFARPAFGQVAFKVLIIIGLVLLYRTMGIFGVAVGVLLGSFGYLLVHISGLWGKRKFYQKGVDWQFSSFAKMRRLMLPLLIGTIFSQISLLVDNMFASTLEVGSIAGLSYAKKLIDLPILAIPYALGIVIFPFFSELALKGNKTELFNMFMKAVRWITLIFMPIIIFLLVLRFPLIRLLFERGKFDAHSTQLTVIPLTYYALGMLTFAVEIIIMQFYFSMEDTRTPITVGVLCVLLDIVLTAIFIRFLSNGGIALSMTCSKTVKVIILFAILKKNIKIISFRPLLKFFLKVGSSTVIMAALLFWFANKLQFLLDFSKTSTLFIHLAAISVVGIVIFLALIFCLRVEEIQTIWNWLIKKRFARV